MQDTLEHSQNIVEIDYESDEDFDSFAELSTIKASTFVAGHQRPASVSRSIQRWHNKRNSMSNLSVAKSTTNRRLTMSSVCERVSMRHKPRSVVDQVSKGS